MWEKLLSWAIPFLTGGIGTSIIAGILGGISRKATRKLCDNVANKLDEDRMCNKIADKVIDKIGNVTLKQSIQPAVESELERVNEKSAERFEKIEKRIEKKFDQVIAIQEKQADYFVDSLVSDSKKQALAEEIEKAKADQKVEIVPVESQIDVKEDKPTTIKKVNKIVR